MKIKIFSQKKNITFGYRRGDEKRLHIEGNLGHVDLLAPTILLSRVWIRGAKSMLISIYLIKIDAGFCFWTVKTDNKRIRGWAMLIKRLKGSGCGSVGRAVAFNTRGPRFVSSHRQNFIEHLFVNLFIINCIEMTKINKKRPGMAFC